MASRSCIVTVWPKGGRPGALASMRCSPGSTGSGVPRTARDTLAPSSVTTASPTSGTRRRVSLGTRGPEIGDPLADEAQHVLRVLGVRLALRPRCTRRARRRAARGAPRTARRGSGCRPCSFTWATRRSLLERIGPPPAVLVLLGVGEELARGAHLDLARRGASRGRGERHSEQRTSSEPTRHPSAPVTAAARATAAPAPTAAPARQPAEDARALRAARLR